MRRKLHNMPLEIVSLMSSMSSYIYSRTAHSSLMDQYRWRNAPKIEKLPLLVFSELEIFLIATFCVARRIIRFFS